LGKIGLITTTKGPSAFDNMTRARERIEKKKKDIRSIDFEPEGGG